jgi:hypothetical protein
MNDSLYKPTCCTFYFVPFYFLQNENCKIVHMHIPLYASNELDLIYSFYLLYAFDLFGISSYPKG